MFLSMLLSTALAGTLVIDAKVATEIRSNGMPVAELTWPGEIRLEVAAGRYDLEAWVAGKPNPLVVEIADKGETRVIVGKTGITTDTTVDPAAEATGPGQVKFRLAGREPLLVQVGSVRHKLHAGDTVDVELESGMHPVKVRSIDGLTIWAQGTLTVEAGSELVVQLAEGRSPEVSGDGGRWEANSR